MSEDWSDDWFEQALEELEEDTEERESDAGTEKRESDVDIGDGEGDAEGSGDAVDADEPTESAGRPVADTQSAADPSPQGEDTFGFAEFGDSGSDAGGSEAGSLESEADGLESEVGGFEGPPAEEGDDFGFGDFGGGATQNESPAIDDDDFDSELDRIKLGIDGLDEMIRGGVPDRSLLAVIGGAGTGKTTFGLQFIEKALRDGERAVFITLEQSEEAVLSTAEEMGWPFRKYQEAGLLSIVVLDPVDMANSLASIRNDISRLIRDFGASRLVLDSVSLLEMMYDHPSRRRSEVYNFSRSLKEAGVTTMLTSEADQSTAYASRHGMVEYLTDGVFFLQYVRSANSQETRTAIEIQKVRNASHSRERKPYEITDSGISVYQQANIF